jgi:hypothetical protein
VFTRTLVQSEIAYNPEKRGESEQVFEHAFWSVKITNLWPRKMGKEAG